MENTSGRAFQESCLSVGLAPSFSRLVMKEPRPFGGPVMMAYHLMGKAFLQKHGGRLLMGGLFPDGSLSGNQQEGKRSSGAMGLEG